MAAQLNPDQSKRHSSRTRLLSYALEPRILFDGAAAATADATAPDDANIENQDAGGALDQQTTAVLDALTGTRDSKESSHLLELTVPVETTTDAIAQANQQAQQLVTNFIRQASDSQLFELFNGGLSEPDTAWGQRLTELRTAVDQDDFMLNVIEMDSASQFTAIAAYTREGPGGEPTVFVNRFWFDMFDAPDATRALVEEFGHAIDDYLNPATDTGGDEGERFATTLMVDNSTDNNLGDLSTQNDHGSVILDGVSYAVEFAAFNFSNAYSMVYDLNNNTNSLGLVTDAIDTIERWADKEQNSHFFNASPTSTTAGTGLGPVTIDDNNYNSAYFSGNDVSAIGINIGGTNYYGWVSRPIKSGGIVRGFYFWTDDNFNNNGTAAANLAAAQNDGNTDGDRSVLDNKGFLLVVDQTWFNQQIATNTSYTINNVKDGNLGTISVANIGSSSDRVDSALNALVDSNSAPTASNDTASGTPSNTLSTGQGNAALEQGLNTNPNPDTEITASIPGSGNVLDNDADSNSDALSVTTVISKLTGASTTALSTGTDVVGNYGTLTIKSDGNWTYTPDNTNPSVNTLLSGSLTEQFTYTVSDGKGGTATATLTVQINGSNDAPVAANDYNSAKESLTDGADVPTTTYAGYNATGNVLTNDTDVDTGDGKTIAGMSVSGSFQVGSSTSVTESPKLVFNVSSGFSAVKSGDALYVLVGSTYYAAYDSTGTNRITLTANPVVSGSTTSLSLSGTPGAYRTSASSFTEFGSSLTNYFKANPGVRLYSDTGAIDYTTTQGKAATVSTVQPATYTTMSSLSGISGTIAVGMSVWNGSTNLNAQVSELIYTSGVLTGVRLDQALTIATNTVLTFSAPSSVGQTVYGAHGTLVLAANGTFTYTPTADNPLLASGQSAVEVFDYTMQDTAGVTSPAKLYITVYGSSTSDPTLVADTGNAYESGVGRDINDTTSPVYESTNDNTTFPGVNATGNVLSNDTPGTGGAVASYTKADGSSLTTAGNTLTGTYGTLVIASNGSYTYTPNNANSAVNALLPGSTLSETFLYRVTNSGGGVSFSSLVITLNGTNDAPVAIADTADVSEDNVLTATGNVLGDDTDVDTGETKVVSRAGTTSADTAVTTNTTSANGLAVGGTYGTLTIGADGSYRYELATSADAARYAALQALTDNQNVNETFRYEVKDTNGATSTTTLTITVTGANEAPINQFNGTTISSTSSTSVSTAANTAIDFTGTKLLSIADADNNLSTITLEVEHGTLSFTSAPSSVTLSASSGKTISISAGNQTQLNAALALLRYTPDNNFYGTDFLSINSADALGARDIDGIAINIPSVFTGPTVKESDLNFGSTPSGNDETATAILTAPSGQTFGDTNQSGTDTYGTWSLNVGTGLFTYTLTSAPAITGSSTTHNVNIVTYDQYGNAVTNVVTVTITDDAPSATANTKSVNEGATAIGNVLNDGTPDSFGADGAKATTPAGGVIGFRAGSDTSTPATTNIGTEISGTYGKLTLNANGSYSYAANPNSVTTAQADVFVYTIEDADGTRSTATLTITVNDAATDTIAVTGYGPVNEGSTYAMFTVTASSSQEINLSVTNGTTALTSPTIEYSSNGTTWTTYTWDGTSGNRPTGGIVYVRVTITSEWDDIYEGSETFSLVATNSTNSSITDSASTSIIDNGTGTKYGPNATDTSTTSLDDDRPNFAINDVTVNEAAGTMTFTVTKTGSTNLASTVDYSFTAGSATTGGSGAANDYTTTAGTLTFAADDTSKQITVTINNDGVYEGSESFTVNLTNASGATIADAAGTGTIKDDGTGGDNDSTNPDPATLDDDRPSFAINDVTVNEAAGTMTFTVTKTGSTNLSSSVDYSFTAGSATTGGSGAANDYTATAGTLIFAAGDTSKQITVTINNDGVYEGSESFTVNLTNASGATIADAAGTGTIKDDGTGGDNDGDNADDAGDNAKNDDRNITVNNIRVNEGSQYAVFTVTGIEGQQVKLSLSSGTATIENGSAPTATDGSEDFGPALQYWNGTAWTSYTANNFISIPTDGDGTTGETARLLVRTTINPDALDESDHSFTLTVENSNGDLSSGIATIDDHGGGIKYLDAAPINPGSTDPVPVTDSNNLDDDRPRNDDGVNVTQIVDFNSSPTGIQQQPDSPTSASSNPTASGDAIRPEDFGWQYGLISWPGIHISGNRDMYQQVWGEVRSELMEATLDLSLNQGGFFKLPPETLMGLDTNDSLRFDASLADGRQLPSWIRFDPNNGSLKIGEDAPLINEPVKVKVVATDTKGNQVTVTIILKAKTVHKPALKPQNPQQMSEWPGKQPLSEQVKMINGRQIAKQLLDAAEQAFAQPPHS